MVPTPLRTRRGKKILKEWIQAFKKGRDEFKETLDESFLKMEDFFKEKTKPQ